jgi:uncharacterized membrane protein (UPF0127 family)
MEKTLLTVGGKLLTVEVASTPEEKSKGLSGREEVADGTGMLFVYSAEDDLSFWMKDTLVPLSIAFIGADKKIRKFGNMAEPLVLDSVRGRGKYALEVPLGWFDENGVKVGDLVTWSSAPGSFSR